MKYYSDVLDTMFNSVEELEEAEADAKAKDVEKDEAKAKVDDLMNDLEMAKERAAELKDEANNMIIEAQNRLDEALNAYCEEYGTYTTIGKDGGKCSIYKCTSRNEDYYDKLRAAEKEFNEVIGDLLDIFRI